MATDPLIDLAEALAQAMASDESLATVSIGGQTYEVTYERPDTPEVNVAEERIRTPLVWVQDTTETLGSDQHPTYDENEIIVVVQMKIPSPAVAHDVDRALSALAHQIARFAKPLDDCLELEAAVCVKTLRYTKNPKDWVEGRFYAQIITTWRCEA